MSETTAARGSSPRRGRLPYWWLIVTAVVVAVLGLSALVGWRVTAADVRDDVSVTWTGPIDCEGTTVEDLASDNSEDALQIVRLRAGMRCVLPFRVTNDSRFTVDVTRIRIPYVGPAAAAAVHVPRLDGDEPIRAKALDAVFGVDERLAPGRSHEWEIVFLYRPGGCSSPDSVERHARTPQVRVLALGRTGTRSAKESIGFRGTRQSDCGA